MKRVYLGALIALAALTLLSLVLNGVLVFELLQLRRAAHRVVTEARSIVTEVADDTLSYTVEVDQKIPVSAEIAFNEAVSVPINTVVPISTTVVVPVNLGFGTYELGLPIQTVFPIDMEVDVPISETVDVTAVVPLEVDVPIEIAISDTPLAGYLRDVNATLRRAEEQLERPIWQSD